MQIESSETWKRDLFLKKNQAEVVVKYQNGVYRLDMRVLVSENGGEFICRRLHLKSLNEIEKYDNVRGKLKAQHQKVENAGLLLNRIKINYNHNDLMYTIITERYHCDCYKLIFDLRRSSDSLEDILIKFVIVLIKTLKLLMVDMGADEKIPSFELTSFKAIRIHNQYTVKFDWMDPAMILGEFTVSEQILKMLYIINNILTPTQKKPDIFGFKQTLQQQSNLSRAFLISRQSHKAAINLVNKSTLCPFYQSLQQLRKHGRSNPLTLNDLQKLLPVDSQCPFKSLTNTQAELKSSH